MHVSTFLAIVAMLVTAMLAALTGSTTAIVAMLIAVACFAWSTGRDEPSPRDR